MSQYGDKLEENIGALFKPAQTDWEKFKSTVELAAALGEELPGLGIAIKVVAWHRAWFADGKKVDRVQPVILGLAERIQKLEGDAKDYIKKPEAQATIEEALGRIADQPDESRREAMRNVLYKIMAQPMEPADNKMFLRLADELPTAALKLLAAFRAPIAPQHATSANEVVLASRTGLSAEGVKMWLKHLGNLTLVDEEQLHHRQHGTFEAFLTPLGKAFAEYLRG